MLFKMFLSEYFKHHNFNLRLLKNPYRFNSNVKDSEYGLWS